MPAAATRGLQGRAEIDLERVHVYPGRAHRRARVAHQTVQFVFDQVGRYRQVTLGKSAGHADPAARTFRLVHRQHIRRTRRQAQPAADAGQHVVVLGIEQRMRRPEGWQGQGV
jgi:hypothetical protein